MLQLYFGSDDHGFGPVLAVAKRGGGRLRQTRSKGGGMARRPWGLGSGIDNPGEGGGQIAANAKGGGLVWVLITFCKSTMPGGVGTHQKPKPWSHA